MRVLKIDTDFYEDDRPKIYNHIINRFGTEKTAYILALGTLADKAVIDVIGKALSKQYRVKHNISLIDNNNPNDPYRLDVIAQIKKEYSQDKETAKEKYKDVFYYYDGLVGCIVSQSQHPAGILVSPINLIETVGAFHGADGQVIVPLDMEECHELGLVKFDILALKSVGVIDKAFKLIGKSFPKAYQINWNDQKVFEDISNDSTSIFQFESQFGHDSIKKMQPRSIDDLSLCSACLRPSGISYRDAVFNHEVHKNPSELIDNVLSNSYGYLCIEENQLMPTTGGIKKIKDIQVGDMVYTHKGINRVNNVYNNGIKEVYNVNTSIGDICCTDNHKILTQYGWVELKDIMKNPNDYCIAVKVNDCGTETYNKDLLKILGWLIGDGILHQTNLQKSHVSFVNTNITIVEDFCSSVNNAFGDVLTTSIKQRETRVNKLPIYYTDVNWKEPYKMRSQKAVKPIVKFLDEHNIFNHLAQDKEVPPFVFNLNKDCILTFLGAYTDTDCCVRQNVLTYHCASYNLLLGIQELYRKLGFSSCLHKNNGDKDFTLSITNANKALCLLKDYSVVVRQQNITTRPGHSDCSTLLPKKYVLNEIIANKQTSFSLKDKKIGLSNNKYISVSILKRIKQDDKYKDIINFNEYVEDENIKWTKIKNINKIGDRNVYDLEIDNVHDFALCGGLIVHNCYQEQTIAFLQQACGLSGSASDTMRRNIAKKQEDKVKAMLPKVIEGYCNNSDKPREVAEEEVKDFIQVIKDASGYQFGFNHSESYSMLSYVMGWLRYYYPTEYCTSYLNCAKNDDDLINGTALAKNRGCKIVNPKFRMSTSEYGCDGSTKTIYKGVGSIKDIGSETGDKLYALKDNHYPTFIDLLRDIDANKCCNSRELDILIRIDYFSEFGNPNQLLKIVEIYNKYANAKVLTKSKFTPQELEIIAKYANQSTEKQFRGIYIAGLLNELVRYTDNIKTTLLEQISADIKYLGYTTRIAPNEDRRKYIVTEMEYNKTGTICNISLYEITTGKTRTFKVWSNTIKNISRQYGADVDISTILYLYKVSKKNKKAPSDKTDKNGKHIWVDIPNEYELWLDAFAIIS